MPTRPRFQIAWNRLHAVRIEIFLFLATWLLFGSFIKSSDLAAYNLQQMGVDAIVEHGTFGLGHSPLPQLQPLGDVFSHGGNLLAAKQPGQFVWGALAYYPLHALGFTYERDYTMTAAWVTWLSSTSFAALAAVLVFVLGFRVWKFEAVPSLLSAGALAVGTNVFAYSGVAHHDIIAGSLALGSFAALEAARQFKRKRLWFVCGLAAGLTVFTSMLPALIVLTILLAAGAFAIRQKSLPFLGAGFAVGIAPLAWYNWHYFGSPLIQANAAGNFSDTFFRPSLAIFLPHLNRYFGWGQLSLWAYAPIAVAGALSIFTFARRREFRLTAALLVAMVAIHTAYILNIETYGHCQFGPRYLLPLMGFLVLPLGFVWRNSGLQTVVLADLALALSVAVNTAGAAIGTMNCDLRQWLFVSVWSGTILSAPASDFSLRSWTLPCFLLILLATALMVFNHHRGRRRAVRPET